MQRIAPKSPWSSLDTLKDTYLSQEALAWILHSTLSTMNLAPIATQFIQRGEGYDIVLAVYELIKRHSGINDPAQEDPSIAWALTTARKIAHKVPASFDEMESCVYVMATALPSEYQDLRILTDEEMVRELSKEAASVANVPQRKSRGRNGNRMRTN